MGHRLAVGAIAIGLVLLAITIAVGVWSLTTDDPADPPLITGG